ncbi:MAG: hypothetical protein ACT4O1_08775 [Gemmatimonadota bacterium]
MRHLYALGAALIMVGCAGQTTADPCQLRVNVLETSDANVGNTREVIAEVEVRSGVCGLRDKELSWRSSRTDIADISSTTDSSALVVAKKAGVATITGFLTRTPAVKDSISLTVRAPVDTTATDAGAVAGAVAVAGN